MYKYLEIEDMQIYISPVLLILNIPLRRSKCTPVWEPLVNPIFCSKSDDQLGRNVKPTVYCWVLAEPLSATRGAPSFCGTQVEIHRNKPFKRNADNSLQAPSFGKVQDFDQLVNWSNCNARLSSNRFILLHETLKNQSEHINNYKWKLQWKTTLPAWRRGQKTDGKAHG